MDDERKEKIKLISFIIDLRLSKDSNRSDDWYGETFDELYEANIDVLKMLKQMTEKNMKK